MSKLYQSKHAAPSGAVSNVFIAIPTYSGQINANCLHSLFQVFPDLIKHGMGYEILIMAGNCHVDDARNGCVRAFMQSDCTDLFFLDADVGFDPEAIAKLLKYDRDIVAGVYPKKCDEEDYPVNVFDGVELWAEPDGLVEVKGAPTGFMRIRRNVIETMWEKFKHRRFKGQQDADDVFPYTIIFERTYENGHRYSGDYAFCKKWHDMGGKIYVDPELPFTHEGTKEWGGVLGQYWRKKYGVDEERFKIAITKLRKGESSPELFNWIHTGWGNPYSCEAEMLAVIYHKALQVKGPILECGSGITTLVLACAAEVTGNEVISLEHEIDWYTLCYKWLTRHNLNGVTQRISPLEDYEGFKWYSEPPKIDYAMVVCDGPQRKYGRTGLFKVLGEQIKNAFIIMDDTDDPNEAKPLQEFADSQGMKVTRVNRFSICEKNHV